MKSKLQDRLSLRRQYPDVIGERRLLRFLRGYQCDVEKAIKKYLDFLDWRDVNNVDFIRDDILQRKRSVSEFPYANKILPYLGRYIVIAPDAVDNYGNPIVYEEMNGNPDAIIRNVTKEEFVEFFIYLHEYRSLVLEQMSHEREQSLLKSKVPSMFQNGSVGRSGYGVVLSCTTIRDFKSFSTYHFGSSGKLLFQWIVEVSNKNYPELLFRSYMVNVPLFYNSAWYFMKGRLSPQTAAKFVVTSVKKLKQTMPESSIPSYLGGQYVPSVGYYDFDLSNTGPFFVPSGGMSRPLASSSTDSV